MYMDEMLFALLKLTSVDHDKQGTRFRSLLQKDQLSRILSGVFRMNIHGLLQTSKSYGDNDYSVGKSQESSKRRGHIKVVE